MRIEAIQEEYVQKQNRGWGARERGIYVDNYVISCSMKGWSKKGHCSLAMEQNMAFYCYVRLSSQ